MQALVEQYQPRTIEAFVGLAAPKALLSRLVQNPYQSAWLSLGPPGNGKTAMSFAVARALNGAIHHVPARQCDLEQVDRICRMCSGYPMIGDRWTVIIDEADQVTGPAQLALLSVLDGTAGLKDVIFLMTANSTKLLHERFLSRLRTLRFDAPSTEEVAAFLAKVWKAERGKGKPDFSAIALEARGNVRSALMTLETELLVPGSFVPSPNVPAVLSPARATESPVEITDLKRRKSEAAKLAWQNSPKLQAMRKRA